MLDWTIVVNDIKLSSIFITFILTIFVIISSRKWDMRRRILSWWKHQWSESAAQSPPARWQVWERYHLPVFELLSFQDFPWFPLSMLAWPVITPAFSMTSICPLILTFYHSSIFHNFHLPGYLDLLSLQHFQWLLLAQLSWPVITPAFSITSTGPISLSCYQSKRSLPPF